MGACAQIPGVNHEISQAKIRTQELKKQQDDLTKQETSLKQQKQKLETNIKETKLRLDKHQEQLRKTQEQKQKLDNARQQFLLKANQVRANQGRRVPAARFWLQQRQEALKEFERSGQPLPGGTASSGASSSVSSGYNDFPTAELNEKKSPDDWQAFNENDLEAVLISLLPVLLNKRSGQLNHLMGKHGERVAARILSEHTGVTISAVATAQGVDLLSGKKRNGKYIVAEVKTSAAEKPFGQMLTRAYGGHLQCSDEWLKNVGIPDPALVQVFGIHINPQTESCMIYRRIDSLAEHWEPVRSTWFPLTDFMD